MRRDFVILLTDKKIVKKTSSYRHPTKSRAMHIGINHKGKITRGTRAHKARECTHFLPHPIEVVMMREPNSYDVVVLG